MHIIIDSNVLFSALIKDSLTRKLILDYEGTFLFPAYIFQEFEEHKEEVKLSRTNVRSLFPLYGKSMMPSA